MRHAFDNVNKGIEDQVKKDRSNLIYYVSNVHVKAVTQFDFLLVHCSVTLYAQEEGKFFRLLALFLEQRM